MNRAQKAVLVLYVLAVMISGFLWVPWTMGGPRGESVPLGYNPIFEPAEKMSRVDSSRVAIELISLTLAAGGLVLVFGD